MKYRVSVASLIGCLYVCTVLICINKIGIDNKKTLVNCVKDLCRMVFTSPVSGNHSFRVDVETPSGIPCYNLHEEDLVKVNLETGKTLGRRKPSIEWYMHVSIYKKLGKANAIVRTHSPYTLGIAISVIDKFQHTIEEAKIVVGNPVLISNKPSGSAAE
ncbi:MAG TPA: class II aldolase/adducin family protein [Candidatus Bathyarchaeia archaeon]|nr:class II aldolase/adducin family protein [Candidatus Bathyarchaeia archaeon]